MDDLSNLGKFNLVYADPPWKFRAGLDTRRAERYYPTLSQSEIESLVPPTEHDAILFMWATTAKLEQAIPVMTAWGFTYKTSIVWYKPQPGMGWYVRGHHEFLLIGKKGTPQIPLPQNRPSSVQIFPRTKHSEKPKEFYAIIEKMFPLLTNRLEMFARNTREGWVSWGNEI